MEALRQHQQLVGLDLPPVAHVDEADVDGAEGLLLSLWDRQDLHPGAGQGSKLMNEAAAALLNDLYTTQCLWLSEG